MKQLREQARTYGTHTLSTYDLLQVILGTDTGKKIMPARIERLMQEYPLPNLLHTDLGELANTLGLGAAKAVQLQAVVELARRMMSPIEYNNYRITAPKDAAQVVMAELSYLDHEEMRVLLLDTKNTLVGNLLCYWGTVNSTVTRVAELFRPAITRQCAGIIVCHNHPSGDTSPSPEDITFTEICVEAGKLLDIELVDHLIIGNYRFISLKERLRW